MAVKRRTSVWRVDFLCLTTGREQGIPDDAHRAADGRARPGDGTSECACTPVLPLAVQAAPPTSQRSSSKERQISRAVKRRPCRGSMRRRMVTRFLHRPVRSRGLSFAVGTRPSARPSRARVPDVPGDASGGGADDPSGHILAGARSSPARCGQESPGMGGSRFSTPSMRTRSRRTAPAGFSTSMPGRSSRRSTRGARAWRPQPLYPGAKTRAGSLKGCVTPLGACHHDQRPPRESAAPDPIDEPPRPACRPPSSAQTPATGRDGDESGANATLPSRLDASTPCVVESCVSPGPLAARGGRPTHVVARHVPRPG